MIDKIKKYWNNIGNFIIGNKLLTGLIIMSVSYIGLSMYNQFWFDNNCIYIKSDYTAKCLSTENDWLEFGEKFLGFLAGGVLAGVIIQKISEYNKEQIYKIEKQYITYIFNSLNNETLNILKNQISKTKEINNIIEKSEKTIPSKEDLKYIFDNVDGSINTIMNLKYGYKKLLEFHNKYPEKIYEIGGTKILSIINELYTAYYIYIFEKRTSVLIDYPSIINFLKKYDQNKYNQFQIEYTKKYFEKYGLLILDFFQEDEHRKDNNEKINIIYNKCNQSDKNNNKEAIYILYKALRIGFYIILEEK